jgi:hypothetical protein
MYSLLELVGLLSPVRSSVQGVISLVVDDVTMVTDEVVHSEASEENAKEVKLTSQALRSIFPALVSLPWSVFIFREQREHQHPLYSDTYIQQ